MSGLRANGTLAAEHLLRHWRLFELRPERPSARARLELALGPELAQRLVSTLSTTPRR